MLWQLKKAARVVFFALTVPLAVHCQTFSTGQVPPFFSETRILFDSQIGDLADLGFDSPYVAAGLDAEIPLGPSARDSAVIGGGHRFEYQPSFSMSPTSKAFALSRHGLIIKNGGIAWIRHRFGVTGVEEYTAYWSGGVHKAAWEPGAGAVIRDAWRARPGRLYVTYYFPTGCQWATPSNPCLIQSPRTRGVEAMQEFRVASFLRVGSEVAVVRYDDQSNENEPSIARTHHTVPYGVLHVDFEWSRVGSSPRAAY